MSGLTYSDLKSLGDRFYKAKQWEQALKAYDEAEESYVLSLDDDFYFKRGFVFHELKRVDEAIDNYESCVALNEFHLAAWTNLGLCHQIVENWQEAKDAYRTATVIKKTEINPWQGLALCAEKLGDKKLRIEAVETVASLLPDNSYWRNEVGRAHLNSGESSGVWRALAAFLESARLDNDPCHPHNAGLVYCKLNKLLDAGDAYRESLHRKTGYAISEQALEGLNERLENLSAKVRDFAAKLAPCKQPYERYLNPFEILSFNGRLAEMPDGSALRKLKLQVIQQIQLNDGRADWLEGAEIGESRVRQILDELDDDRGQKNHWHWIIYECPEFNRFLSHGDPLYFAFFTDSLTPPPLTRPLYWQMHDKSCSEEAFFKFIHAPFLANFEALIVQALNLNDPDLVKALSSGRLPTVDPFEYFRSANNWLDGKASEVRSYMAKLSTPEGMNWWKQTPDPMAWLSVPLANALPDECKAGRTELARALRSLGIELHNGHALTDQALNVTAVASRLLVEESLIAQIEKDKALLVGILTERKKQEAEEAKWNKTIQIRSDEFEVNKAFVRYNNVKISADEIVELRFGIFIQILNGVPKGSYLIEVRGENGKISTECKRIFRSEDQARADFMEILQALYHQIIPRFIMKQAELISSGKTSVQIGPLLLTKHGVRYETGAFTWKRQHLLPFDVWTFSDNQGHVDASARSTKTIRFSLDRRAVWNAVILENLVGCIKQLQS
jgi:tetratricopeptide (TPR) repeat protein